MNKNKIILILFLNLTLSQLYGQKLYLESFTIHAGSGFSMGKTEYSSINYGSNSAALFTNMKSYKSYGADFSFKLKNKWDCGLYINYGTFSNWTNPNTNRFEKSTLTALHIGPLISCLITKSNTHLSSKLLIAPLFTKISLTNPKSSYYFNLLNNVDGQIVTEKVIVNELYHKKEIWAPGLFCGEDFSFFLKDCFLINLRLGLNISYSKTDAFPDKILILPAVNIGFGFNYRRNKWYFL